MKTIKIKVSKLSGGSIYSNSYLPLFLLTRKGSTQYENYRRMVIAALDEPSARNMADRVVNDDNDQNTWNNYSMSSCQKIADFSIYINETFVIGDYNNA